MFSRLLKNAHLRRFPYPSSLRRTLKYASLLRTSGALHLGIFEQPVLNHFFSILLEAGFHFGLAIESFFCNRKVNLEEARAGALQRLQEVCG